MAGELLVDPPLSVQTEHGLLSSAQTVYTDTGDAARWVGSGVRFLAPPCGGLSGFDPSCDSTGASDDMNTTPPTGTEGFVDVRPAVFYASDSCTLPLVHSGGADVLGRASYVVAAGLQTMLERELWEGTIAGQQDVTLTNSPTVLTGTAVELATGLAMLEDALNMPGMTGGLGTIHLPTLAGASLVNGGGLVVPDGRRLKTASKGHTVIIGDGYSGSGPGNVTPATGTLWLYATGPVVVRLAPVREFDPNSNPAYTDRTTNGATAIVQQPAIVYHDTCRSFAVLVNVPGATNAAGSITWIGSPGSLRIGANTGGLPQRIAGSTGGALTVGPQSGVFAGGQSFAGSGANLTDRPLP